MVSGVYLNRYFVVAAAGGWITFFGTVRKEWGCFVFQPGPPKNGTVPAQVQEQVVERVDLEATDRRYQMAGHPNRRAPFTARRPRTDTPGYRVLWLYPQVLRRFTPHSRNVGGEVRLHCFDGTLISFIISLFKHIFLTKKHLANKRFSSILVSYVASPNNNMLTS